MIKSARRRFCRYLSLDQEKGAIALEAAIVIPVFLVASLATIFSFYGKMAVASDTETAAQEAARAASQQDSIGEAQKAAQKYIDANTAGSDLECSPPQIKADLRPGGFVELTLTCESFGLDIPLLRNKKFSRTSTAYEVVDQFKSAR